MYNIIYMTCTRALTRSSMQPYIYIWFNACARCVHAGPGRAMHTYIAEEF